MSVDHAHSTLHWDRTQTRKYKGLGARGKCSMNASSYYVLLHSLVETKCGARMLFICGCKRPRACETGIQDRLFICYC